MLFPGTHGYQAISRTLQHVPWRCVVHRLDKEKTLPHDAWNCCGT